MRWNRCAALFICGIFSLSFYAAPVCAEAVAIAEGRDGTAASPYTSCKEQGGPACATQAAVDVASAQAQVAASPAETATAPSVTIIDGTPLKIHIGSDNSFQVFNMNVPGRGQIYPDNATSTADMGWFVYTSGTLYAPDFDNHPDGTSTTIFLGDYTPQTGTVSGVSGSGTNADPFRVSVASTLGFSNLAAVMQVSYVNGNNYVSKVLTLTNNGSNTRFVKIFLGADIYLANDDDGVPFLDPTSQSPGGEDCGRSPNYHILLIPQTQADAYSATAYGVIWTQIGSASLDGTVDSKCEDDGAALQWNRSIEAGASVSIQAATSFGEIPSITQFEVTSIAPASGTQGNHVDVAIAGVGFESDTAFDFGAGVAVTNLQIVNDSSASATLAIDSDAAAGPRNVTGRQSPGGRTSTLADGFAVTAAEAQFDIASVSPRTGLPGTTANVTISGSGFASDSSFDFGTAISVTNLTIVNDATAVASLQIAADAPVGSRNVAGLQSPGGVAATLIDGFAVVAGDTPEFEVISVSPATGRQGADVGVTLSGAAFRSDTTFDFGEGIAVQNLLIVDAGTASATLRIDADATVGVRDVTGLQSPGGSAATLSEGFAVTLADSNGMPPSASGEAPVPSPAFGVVGGGMLIVMLALSGFFVQSRRLIRRRIRIRCCADPRE